MAYLYQKEDVVTVRSKADILRIITAKNIQNSLVPDMEQYLGKSFEVQQQIPGPRPFYSLRYAENYQWDENFLEKEYYHLAAPKKYEEGQLVLCTNNNGSQSNYTNWLTQHAPQYTADYTPSKQAPMDTIYKIMKIAPFSETNSTLIALIQHIKTKQIFVTTCSNSYIRILTPMNINTVIMPPEGIMCIENSFLKTPRITAFDRLYLPKEALPCPELIIL